MSELHELQLEFPYNLKKLNWNDDHTRNEENVYCYCGNNIEENESHVKCEECGQLFHSKCVRILKRPQLIGDIFYNFKCSVCCKGNEFYSRRKITWKNCLQLVIYNIIKNKENSIEKDNTKKRFCRFKEDICTFINDYWEYFYPNEPRSDIWHDIVAETLNSNTDIFLSGVNVIQESGWWSLNFSEIPKFDKLNEKTKSQIDTIKKEINPSLRKRNSKVIEDDEDDIFLPIVKKKRKKKIVILNKGNNEVKKEIIVIKNKSEKVEEEHNIVYSNIKNKTTSKSTNEDQINDKTYTISSSDLTNLSEIETLLSNSDSEYVRFINNEGLQDEKIVLEKQESNNKSSTIDENNPLITKKNKTEINIHLNEEIIVKEMIEEKSLKVILDNKSNTKEKENKEKNKFEQIEENSKLSYNLLNTNNKNETKIKEVNELLKFNSKLEPLDSINKENTESKTKNEDVSEIEQITYENKSELLEEKLNKENIENKTKIDEVGEIEQKPYENKPVLLDKIKEKMKDEKVNENKLVSMDEKLNKENIANKTKYEEVSEIKQITYENKLASVDEKLNKENIKSKTKNEEVNKIEQLSYENRPKSLDEVLIEESNNNEAINKKEIENDKYQKFLLQKESNNNENNNVNEVFNNKNVESKIEDLQRTIDNKIKNNEFNRLIETKMDTIKDDISIMNKNENLNSKKDDIKMNNNDITITTSNTIVEEKRTINDNEYNFSDNDDNNKNNNNNVIINNLISNSNNNIVDKFFDKVNDKSESNINEKSINISKNDENSNNMNSSLNDKNSDEDNNISNGNNVNNNNNNNNSNIIEHELSNKPSILLSDTSKENFKDTFNSIYKSQTFKSSNDDLSIRNEINNQIYNSLRNQKIQDIEEKEYQSLYNKKIEKKSFSLKDIQAKRIIDKIKDKDKDNDDNITLSDIDDDNKEKDKISLSDSDLSLDITKQIKSPGENNLRFDNEFSSNSDDYNKGNSKYHLQPRKGKGKQPRKGKGKGLYTGSKSLQQKNNSEFDEYHSDYESISEDDSENDNYNKDIKIRNKMKDISIMNIEKESLVLRQIKNYLASSKHARRLYRRLQLRKIKRSSNIPIFNIDKYVKNYLSSKVELTPISKIKFKRNNIITIEKTPYKNSFKCRLFGKSLDYNHTLDFPVVSKYTGIKLMPYIYRNYDIKPAKLRLLEDIVTYHNRNNPKWKKPKSAPIDFVHLQKEHVDTVNDMLCHAFWPGINVSEQLMFPDFSIIAMYKRLIIGCAFITPEAYITYIYVRPEWGNSGIGKFMLYYLIQSCIGKDITLHVSANNKAMLMYQKFGFKAEEFNMNFYEKYLPADSLECKNAFLLRLRR